MAATMTGTKPARSSLWRMIGEALRGAEQDFTELPIGRAIFLLAIPMVLEMLMESVFALVDVYWVTRLGAGAVAAVGLTESMMALIFALAMGVSMSTTAMVARRVGEKDMPGARSAAVQAILLGAILALATGLPAFLLAPRLLGWMGAAPDVIASGSGYTALVLGGNITVMLLFLNNAIFRGAGDAATAMRVLAASNFINLLLDPCLIFGWGPFPELGVTGAGLATVIGRGCGVLYQFWRLGRGGSRLRIGLSDLRIHLSVMGTLVRVSTTGIFQFAVAHTSWVVLVRFISEFGSAAVAGYTIGIRIFVFLILPSWGLSGAASTMVGQNLGAKRPDRAEQAVWLTGYYNVIFLAAVAVLFIAVPESLVRLFTSDPAVIPFAVDCLRIICFGNLAYAYGMVMVQAFNGAGDTVTPTLINLVGFWLCEIPLAWALAFPAGMGARGVFTSIPLAESLITVMGLLMFRTGRWKHNKI